MANYLTPSTGRPTGIALAGTRSKKDVQYVDQMYKVRVYNRGSSNPIDISGYTPEDFAINIMANWDEPFGAASDIGGSVQAVSQGFAGSTVAAGIRAFGRNSNIAGSAKVWSGGTSLLFDLPLKVSAYDDTREEVMEPFKKILMLCAPDLGAGGMLVAPGPIPPELLKGVLGNLKNLQGTTGTAQQWENTLKAALEESAFYLEIGKFFKMFPAIITNVSANFNGMFEHGTGFPTSVELNLTIESYLTPTKYDIENWVLTG